MPERAIRQAGQLSSHVICVIADGNINFSATYFGSMDGCHWCQSLGAFRASAESCRGSLHPQHVYENGPAQATAAGYCTHSMYVEMALPGPMQLLSVMRSHGPKVNQHQIKCLVT